LSNAAKATIIIAYELKWPINLSNLKQQIVPKLTGRDPINQFVFFISSLACIAVFPLLYIRTQDQNFPMVALDAVLVIALFTIAAMSYSTKYQNFARVSLGVVLVTGMIATTIMGSKASVFWLYPGVIAIFFIFQPKWALISTLAICITIFPFLRERMLEHDWIIFYVTLIPTIVFVFYFSKALRRQHLELHSHASQDFLTNTGNRRAFTLQAERSITNKQKFSHNAVLILFDMDHFKQLNDNHGHVIGDAVLKNVTALVRKSIRNVDRLYRIGGEEFAVVVHSDRLSDAVGVAEKIQRTITTEQTTELPSYTVSFGIAEIQSNDSVEAWMNRADQALYHSKQHGRNKITCA
jgi:diguanylate cyclase (GGDEF)-like protein